MIDLKIVSGIFSAKKVNLKLTGKASGKEIIKIDNRAISKKGYSVILKGKDFKVIFPGEKKGQVFEFKFFFYFKKSPSIINKSFDF